LITKGSETGDHIKFRNNCLTTQV